MKSALLLSLTTMTTLVRSSKLPTIKTTPLLRFSQIPQHVHIRPSCVCRVMFLQLQRNHVQDQLEHVVVFRRAVEAAANRLKHCIYKFVTCLRLLTLLANSSGDAACYRRTVLHVKPFLSAVRTTTTASASRSFFSLAFLITPKTSSE